MRDKCKMCSHKRQCNDEIEKICQGRFLLDKGLSYFWQVIANESGTQQGADMAK